MKAAYFTDFQSAIRVESLPYPSPSPDGVIIEVRATGICRSDWHGWMGHDSDVKLPHVPGHELAGIVVEAGKNVRHWKKGDRITLPICCGCGYCRYCASGDQHICDNYFQPGFTTWGSFAEYVLIEYADVNLVRIPEIMSFDTAAALGCRFITAYRGVVAQGRLQSGDWIAIHGCGGVGLSAIMIANAIGARTIAVDIDDKKLDFARMLGANIAINASNTTDIPAAIQEITSGGATVSIDALGSTVTCQNSIHSLKKRGKHIQIGLMVQEHATPAIPMGIIMSNELEILGSHGMQAHRYPEMLDLIYSRNIPLEKMIGQRMTLEDGAKALMEMDRFKNIGIMVIDQF